MDVSIESALLVAHIRPSGWQTLLYETLILANQGVPYVYVIRDRILPTLRERATTQTASRRSPL